MILPDFGEGIPVPDTAKGPAATAMKTNPQMEFTPEDFEQYGNFDADGSNPYGIEMPGTPPKTEKNAAAFPSYSEATVVLPHSQAQQSSGERDFQEDEGDFQDGEEAFRYHRTMTGRNPSPGQFKRKLRRRRNIFLTDFCRNIRTFGRNKESTGLVFWMSLCCSSVWQP